MRLDRWFMFADPKLNKKLIALVDRSPILHAVGVDGRVYYHSSDEESFEDILAQVRAAAFPAWQVLSSPSDWLQKYRSEMEHRKIPHHEELNNSSVEFLLPRSARPHTWQME